MRAARCGAAPGDPAHGKGSGLHPLADFSRMKGQEMASWITGALSSFYLKQIAAMIDSFGSLTLQNSLKQNHGNSIVVPHAGNAKSSFRWCCVCSENVDIRNSSWDLKSQTTSYWRLT
jgi:hypothetical protein